MTDRPAGGRRSGSILAIDTATSSAVVAVGSPDGVLLAVEAWQAGHRHGEELIARIDAVLELAAIRLDDLGGIVIGLGPGAFTGLRVGLATAKGLAHGLSIPIAGVATGEALADAARAGDSDRPAGAGGPSDGHPVILLPAGPSDRIMVTVGRAVLLAGGTEPDDVPSGSLVAVDLEGRAPADAVARGSLALDGLAAALVRIGARRLAAGQADDLDRLVPEYVTLPRGVAAETGTVAWSHDRP